MPTLAGLGSPQDLEALLQAFNEEKAEVETGREVRHQPGQRKATDSPKQDLTVSNLIKADTRQALLFFIVQGA